MDKKDIAIKTTAATGGAAIAGPVGAVIAVIATTAIKAAGTKK